MRLVLVARPEDIADRPFDGFLEHNRTIFAHLEQVHHLSLVTLRTDGDDAEPHLALAACPRREVALPKLDNRRAARVKRVAGSFRRAHLSPWEASIVGAVEDAQPDLVITLGPWLLDEFNAVHRRFRCVHFFHEDLYRMPDLHPQSHQARALRWVEDRTRWLTGACPTSVVVLGPQEVERARRKFGRPTTCVPFTLDPDVWTPAPDAPADQEPFVLVVGNLNQQRNAEGLCSVLSEMDDRDLFAELPVRLVSDRGLHADVAPYVAARKVVHSPCGPAIADEYQGARLVLVPSTRSTGVKTTVLQAWARQRPVVTFQSSLASVGRSHADALAAGRDAKEVVDLMCGLWRDPQRRSDMARRGRMALESDFHREKALAALESVLTSDAASGLHAGPVPSGRW